MEEKSRHLGTLAKLGTADLDLLHKQYEYQQKYVNSSQDKLLEIIKNVTSISQQLENLDHANGKLGRDGLLLNF